MWKHFLRFNQASKNPFIQENKTPSVTLTVAVSVAYAATLFTGSFWKDPFSCSINNANSECRDDGDSDPSIRDKSNPNMNNNTYQYEKGKNLNSSSQQQEHHQPLKRRNGSFNWHEKNQVMCESKSSEGDEHHSEKEDGKQQQPLDPSFKKNTSAITFRRRRLSLNAAQDLQPSLPKEQDQGQGQGQEQGSDNLNDRTQATDAGFNNVNTSNSERGHSTENVRKIYPKHRIMYSSEFELDQAVINPGSELADGETYNVDTNGNKTAVPSFPLHQVGTYSCHGIEPHPYVVYSKADSESDLDPANISFFQTLFGAASMMNTSDTDSSYRPARVVTVSKRKINQDRGHVIYPYLPTPSSNSGYESDVETRSKKRIHKQEQVPTALFGAYDGHGEKGELVAKYAMDGVGDKLHLHPNYRSQYALPEDHNLQNQHHHTGIQKAFRDVFLEIDSEIEEMSYAQQIHGGSTACVALLQGQRMWVANVGDSRAVMGRRRNLKSTPTGRTQSSTHAHPYQNTHEAVDLSKDQNAHDEAERERILKSGGFITIPRDTEFAARIWADKECTEVGLAMSRSIGDFALKHVGVTADPVVEHYELRNDDEFFIIATDGVWEFISSQDAVEIVQECFENGLGASDACKKLIRVAMDKWKEKEGDYRDDITAIVVRLDGLWDSATAGR